jgi:hypothetical protein
MIQLVNADNLHGLRALIEDADVLSPGLWQTAKGRFTLRVRKKERQKRKNRLVPISAFPS